MVKKRKHSLIAFLFLLPSLLGIGLFYIVPYFICLYNSFISYGTFAGLDNYIELFHNNAFLLALKNTLIFSFTAIPLLLIISFLIALFLNSFEKISSFFRSTILLPIIIPSASLICIWQIVFEDYGAINAFLNGIGLDHIAFFEGPMSMVMTILIYIWKNCGFCVVLFTAGLANVPVSLYESARLDGASRLKIATQITIPMITPTTFFVCLISIIFSFKIFREVYVLFGNYPNKHIYMLQHFINANYNNLNYSRLSSASVVLSIIIIALMFIFFMFERKRNYLE